MTRERVIVEIVNLGQASKIEDTVKTGYCDVIKDYIVHWIAVEEDLNESYMKLHDKFTDQTAKKAMRKLASESSENVASLKELLKKFDDFAEAKASRRKMLEELKLKTD